MIGNILSLLVISMIVLFVLFVLAAVFMGHGSGSGKSMLVKDNALRYEQRDSKGRTRQVNVDLSSADRWLDEKGELNLPDGTIMYKVDPDKKSSVNNLAIRLSKKEVKTLKDIYGEDEERYNEIAAFLKRIEGKDDLDLDFRMRTYAKESDLILKGSKAMETFRKLKSQIKDEEIRNKLTMTIEDIARTNELIDQVDSLEKTRKLYDNYLPMLEEITENYKTLEKHDSDRKELNEARVKVLDTFNLIDAAFDSLFIKDEEDHFAALEASVADLEKIARDSKELLKQQK